MKRVFPILLAVVLILYVFCICASAVSFDNDVKIYSDSVFMVNLDADMPVFEKNPDEKLYPASLTKIMTYIIAVEYFEDYDNTRIEVTQDVFDYIDRNGMTSSGLEYHIGEKMTVTDLLYALMVPVGHDAALVLSDYISTAGGTDFVTLMNNKATELKCESTHFANPTGVHDNNHYTTARDLYKITKYAMGLPLFSKICSTATYYLEGDDYPLVTTNYMIDDARGGDYYYTYATGVKNGTTVEAGRCLVSTAMYDGYTYMCICLHAPYDEKEDENPQYCMEEAANLFRWAFLNLKYVKHSTASTPICEQKVDHAWDMDSILLVPETDLNIILPADCKDGDVTIVPDSTAPVSAPISKGDVVTTATVLYKGTEFMKINLVSHDDVKLSPILYTTDIIKSILTSFWFLLAVAIVVILFVVYVAVSSSYNKKKNIDKKRKYR